MPLCVFVLSAYTCVSISVCVCPSGIAFLRKSVSQQVQTANTLTCLTHSAPEPLMGALYCSFAGPAPKTSYRAAVAVRTQTKPPFTSSTQLFIFRGIRGNTRQGLSDPNSRTSLLFYTQASSQLSLIFSNCFLSCLVE